MNDLELERLVDGELSPPEYRSLLASLDDEPGGWRQCALAFLEAQALASELAGIRGSLDLSHDRPVRSRSRHIERRDLWTFFAVAASFLVALGIGILSPRLFPLIQGGS